ncbi:ABC transporter six-transmembrane domain-containing protein [Qipengyuania qiaonensis]|uniref:ABC transporter six-transmembrane domain-containing protein n=1 Tax=Qipengyuania qiaonensis TaxID=2867240 RepID=A0ABS7J691_9SPHN|nr:ABC transporter six-transmembrane domain-containing protein [Qipengyuania qiaonensis]MBX7482837.1 ABC transporter six-transmembrane domain-containing protein [Qipengyuania qiaonensis]
MLLELVRVHRGRLLTAYCLTAGGLIAALLYPLATGLAINGVLSGAYIAVLWLVGCHAAQLVLTVASKRYDTRVYTRIYGALASDIVDRSRTDGLEPARVAARVALSREYTVFLEEDVPRILYAGIALIVSLSALAFLEPSLALACLALGLPLLLIGRWLGRRSSFLNKGLNNRLENEVGLLAHGSESKVRRHFTALAGWRIKLSDAESTAFGLMEILVIVLFVIALWQVGTADKSPQAGDVFAIFSYLWRFVESLDQIPILIQKIAKLKDLNRRLASVVA